MTEPPALVTVTSPDSTVTPYWPSSGPPQTVVPRMPMVPTGVSMVTLPPDGASTSPPTNRKAPWVTRIAREPPCLPGV